MKKAIKKTVKVVKKATKKVVKKVEEAVASAAPVKKCSACNGSGLLNPTVPNSPLCPNCNGSCVE